MQHTGLDVEVVLTKAGPGVLSDFVVDTLGVEEDGFEVPHDGHTVHALSFLTKHP